MSVEGARSVVAHEKKILAASKMLAVPEPHLAATASYSESLPNLHIAKIASSYNL